MRKGKRGAKGTIVPEFSRPTRVEDLEEGESVVTIAATPTERDALAVRFGLLALDRLEAALHVLKSADSATVRVTGTLAAEATQACVVTLEPVKTAINAEVALAYGGGVPPEEGEIDLSSASEDPPEPIVGGIIDLGEAVAELMALELDPFPRAPGAKFPGFSSTLAGSVSDAPGANPFAALAKLKSKL
jgi:uncharacterized metal-binding protein YceD (DUF177 family)